MIDELIENLENKINIAKGENYIVANLSNETINSDMRGWICGHFYPKGSVFHRHDIEICFKTLLLGEKEQAHHHLCSFEFLLILSGKVEYEIDGDRHIMNPGMFYMLHPGNTERLTQVFEQATVLAVRLPSIPGNKVYAEDTKDALSACRDLDEVGVE
ncbi:MAG: cupin domain-containing protein [Candidatus Omnitrophota bacterium]